MRTPEDLLASGLAVIDLAFDTPALYARKGKPKKKYAEWMLPLFSGGHDSTCACHVASRHPEFQGKVHHIDTGIGAKRTRRHVEETAAELEWKLKVYKSPETYEKFVRERGFPGPGRHHWVYVRLKDRCIRMMAARRRVVLVTGCRSQESIRRMGHVEPLKIGEVVGDVVKEKNRYWSAPCHDWSGEEQNAYMDYFDLPRNPLKLKLGMSGECLCGAFAAPGELDRIRVHVPDVAAEIDRLTKIALECGTHAVWGTRPPKQEKGKIKVPRTGPLCQGCDYKAVTIGIEFESVSSQK